MSSSHLTLLIPHLLWPEPQDIDAFDDLAAPGMATLLARARLERQPQKTWEEALLDCLTPQGSLAMLRRQGEADGPCKLDGHWLCADPVHLKFHHERVVLADTSAFALSEAESTALIDALNREFADIGLFQAPHPQRWYLHLETALAYSAQPLSAAAGRTLELPESGDASQVKRWLNEIQMFLHAHPVNQAREAQGLPMVNSLWLWGNHQAPATSSGEFSGIWSDQPLAIGLGRVSGVPQHPAAIDLGNVLAHAAPDSRHLILLDSLLTPALYEDSAAWRDALLQLEEHWFAPLLRQPQALSLIAPTRYGCLHWHFQPRDRYKFWRRPQSLAALARSLA